jgi:glycosyltransferase involved in cell wall biosynthesis
VDLHVLIEVTPESRNKNILAIEEFPPHTTIIAASELIDKKSYEYFRPYFEGCASVNFVIHPHKTGFSLTTLQASWKAWQWIRGINPSVINIESFTLRSLALIPYLFSKRKIFIIIHDPVPHLGEKKWKGGLADYLLSHLPYPRNYFFYSQYARLQFEKHYKKDKGPKYVLGMYPYFYYKKCVKMEDSIHKYMLFFGRLSAYKGIEVLLKSMSLVFPSFPDELLIVAGREIDGYSLDTSLFNGDVHRIELRKRYIPTQELVSLIKGAKFVICPYVDASQSGVLMTAFGLGTPCIVTNVGAFPEFVSQNVNGMIVPANDPIQLAEAIKAALRNDFYLSLAHNVTIANEKNLWTQNKNIILHAYEES